MVSFSNMDGAHCDSVVDHYTLPSNSIQMDVKVPVQPSNFDPLQKGALMGASTFMEQDKNHSNQCNYKTKSIPSPGTTIQRTRLMAGFCFSGFCKNKFSVPAGYNHNQLCALPAQQVI